MRIETVFNIGDEVRGEHVVGVVRNININQHECLSYEVRYFDAHGIAQEIWFTEEEIEKSE